MQILRSCALALGVMSSMAMAETSPVSEQITQTAGKLGLEVTAAADSVLPGIKELTTNRGVYYVSDDGKYFIAGNVYDMNGFHPVNLTEQRQAELNKAQLDALADEMIVYKAENEQHVVSVFTDTSCGYCQKLHDEMASYNAAGITVRYLAFPRGGLNSGNFGQMSAIWCADDQNAAMDEAKAGGFRQSSDQCNDIVSRHYDLGVNMGVRGTPAIILEDGNIVPGYQPAAALKLRLTQSETGS